MTEQNDQTFNTTKKQGSTLVFFYTKWCCLCPGVDEIIAEMEQAASPKFCCIKVDFDQSPIAAKKYGIWGFPAVAYFKDEELVDILFGVQPSKNYKEALQNLALI
ncbi:MAG: hypothetical protein LBM65_02615 [Oscillospiraceae bacterium]|jgi:thioredoxin-like negative regulator of GroEL|nr:hypothetical protein [Oscillospiraceae bacterium]